MNSATIYYVVGFNGFRYDGTVMMGVGMDKRDIDLMNDEDFWKMNEETLAEQEFVTL